MNEYEDYLEHGFFQNGVNGIRKAWGTATHNAPKYIKKIGNRYFYTQQELNAYLHKGMNQVQKGAKYLAQRGISAAKKDLHTLYNSSPHQMVNAAEKDLHSAYNAGRNAERGINSARKTATNAYNTGRRNLSNAANAQYENSWLKRGERAVSSAKKNLTSFTNSASRAISGGARSVAAKAKHAWDYDVTGNGYRKEAAAAGRRANEASSKAQRAKREANGHSMKANQLNGEYVKARRGGNAMPQHVARMQYTSRRSGEETAAAKRSNESARNYQSVADSQMAAARRANAKANNSLLSRGERMASNIGEKITGANALKRYNQETKNVANYIERIQSKKQNTTNPDEYRTENYLRRNAEINARKAKRDYDNSLAGRVNNLRKYYRR